MIGNSLGYVDIHSDQKKKEKEKEEEEEEEEKSDSSLSTKAEAGWSEVTTATTIDISDKKTRIEMEIKLLEELLQAKQKQLKNLA